MIHDQNNNQIWIVGGIEPESKKESFDIINNFKVKYYLLSFFVCWGFCSL